LLSEAQGTEVFVHPLLEDQLAQAGVTTASLSPQLATLLEQVSRSYETQAEAVARAERSLTLVLEEFNHRFEEQERDLEERARVEGERDSFFRLSADLLCVTTKTLHVLEASASWEAVFGYRPRELQGAYLTSFVHPQDRDAAVEQVMLLHLGREPTVRFTCRVRCHDQSYRDVAWTMSTDLRTGNIYAVVRDITEQRKLEGELRQAQKLEAVGQLASGVAHEINTPVQFIGDNLAFLADVWNDSSAIFSVIEELLRGGQLSPALLERLRTATEAAELDYMSEEVPRALVEARDGVRRVAELVRALKEYAHPDLPDAEAADLNHIIQRTLVLARGAVKHVADVEVSLGELPPVPCHAGVLGQVILNLVVNAAHAIEDRKGGRGRIGVRSFIDGTTATIAISDTGTGIPVEIQGRIFDPFFTTKEVGRGTGQGLALARTAIVEKHRGELRFETVQGEGTTFFIELPLAGNPNGLVMAAVG
jgi:PAS domain S-box-containing protein